MPDTAVNRRKGTTAQHAAFTGLLGETTYDTDLKRPVVHDGVTPGGFPVAMLHLAQTFAQPQTMGAALNMGTHLINNVVNPVDPQDAATKAYVDAAPLTLSYRATAVTTTFLATDYTIDCTSGTFTVNLPTAVGITGRIYVLKNSGVGTITLDPAGAELVDSLPTATLVSGAAIMVQSTGTGWIII